MHRLCMDSEHLLCKDLCIVGNLPVCVESMQTGAEYVGHSKDLEPSPSQMAVVTCHMTLFGCRMGDTRPPEAPIDLCPKNRRFEGSKLGGLTFDP